MSEFINVIVNDLAQIDHGSLMYLESSLRCYLEAGSVHYTEVSNKVATVTVDNNELTFPQFLIISNDIVV